MSLIERKMSTRGIASSLSTSQTNVRYWLRKYELSTRKPSVTVAGPIVEAELPDLVARSRNVAAILRSLGRANSGSSHSRITKLIHALDLDTSHFEQGSQVSNGPAFDAELKLKLFDLSEPTPRGAALRRALLYIGRPYECERCKNPGTWMGETITLQVDHINGSRLDNRRENLRFLCPNCHTLTPTYGFRGSNAMRTPEEIALRKTCPGCRGTKSVKSKTCIQCARRAFAEARKRAHLSAASNSGP